MAAYRPYLEQRYHERFDEFLVEYEAGRADSRDPVSTDHFDKAQHDPYVGYMLESGAIDGLFDVDRRLKEVGSQGVAAEVLFTNGIPFQFLQAKFDIPEPDLAAAGMAAYNRWLADFVSQAPGAVHRAGVTHLRRRRRRDRDRLLGS